MQKDCQRNNFLKWLYFHLPLDDALFLKISWKMQPISLYWFTTQQETNTSRRQKFKLFYPNFGSQFNELTLKFQKQQEVAKKS